MYDIVIIGAGPAGLTASIYGARASKKVLVLEANTYGGQIINTMDIANYPAKEHISGFDFANDLYNQAVNIGVEVVFEKAVSIKNGEGEKEVVTSDNTYKTKTIIIATGSENRKLGLENEDKLIGRGISYCATCDGAFFRNKDVAVVGGGNTAIEDALYLADIVNKVYLIHRRDEFRADEYTLNKIKEKDNIELVLNSNVTKLIASEKLNAIEVTNKDGGVKELKVDGLFVAIGRVPENENFKTLVNTDKDGYIKALEDCLTNVEGIYVAGDNRTKELRQLVTATSDGAMAATQAIKYVNSL